MFTPKKNIHGWVWLQLLSVFAIHVYVLRVVAGLSWDLTLMDSGISTAMLALSLWSIVLLIRTYPTTAVLHPYAVFISIVISLLSTVGDWEILKWWVVNGNLEYKAWLSHSIPLRFIISWVLYSWVATNSALRKQINTLDTRFQQQSDASVLLKEAELFKLRQQLQPHFLYNSLNSISALIMIEPGKAQEMIARLSDFLRSSVQRESEDTLPVQEELNYISSYLAIESVRFGDRLEVNIDQKHRPGATLPPFLLQPILENAIKFGLYGRTGHVTIDIVITSEGNMLVITVTNPYDANAQPPKGTGFGLEGIRRRLYLLYARADLLDTAGDGDNFTTTLKIPQSHV